jgi:hypothetical protein
MAMKERGGTKQNQKGMPNVFPYNLNLLHCRQNHNLFMKRNERENKENAVRLIAHRHNARNVMTNLKLLCGENSHRDEPRSEFLDLWSHSSLMYV